METCKQNTYRRFGGKRGGRRLFPLMLVAVLVMVGWFCTASTAGAVVIISSSATLTADNHYALYVGTADGSILNFVGRNEPGALGDPGLNNWTLPETFINFELPPGWYLYVVAWDGDVNPNSIQMWIGQFLLPDGSMLYSNTTDWVYTPGSGPNPLNSGILPAEATIQSDIASASWNSPQATIPYGQWWGSIPEINPPAAFIWADTVNPPSSFDDTYVIFRSEAAMTPIPGSVLLLGTGLLGLGLLGWRRKKS